jgi:MGT family glycosyltransferase
VKLTIAEALPDLDRDLKHILKETRVDLILTSSMYLGAFPLLLSAKHRPPVICCSVNPLMLSSVDCGVMFPPDNSPGGRERVRKANLQMQKQSALMQEAMNASLHQCGAPLLSEFYLDAIYKLPDLVLQCSGEAFEFPRSDMPANLHFVGPILPTSVDNFEEPIWWNELDDSRPVILVTQGTLANRNLDDLIQPALTALANDDVLVIAATGRPDHEGLIVPENARVVSFIPFAHLFPKVAVLVTNGGFGAVQQCLSFGVPLIISGESEDKAYTAVRVEWSGVGINLNPGRPTGEQLRSAVHTVLENKSYRQQARCLQKNIAQHDALAEIAWHVDTVLIQTSNMADVSEAM